MATRIGPLNLVSESQVLKADWARGEPMSKLSRTNAALAVGVRESREPVGTHAGGQLYFCAELGGRWRPDGPSVGQEGLAGGIGRLVAGVVGVEVASRTAIHLDTASRPADAPATAVSYVRAILAAS
jgi:hypothetical protein